MYQPSWSMTLLLGVGVGSLCHAHMWVEMYYSYYRLLLYYKTPHTQIGHVVMQCCMMKVLYHCCVPASTCLNCSLV